MAVTFDPNNYVPGIAADSSNYCDNERLAQVTVGAISDNYLRTAMPKLSTMGQDQYDVLADWVTGEIVRLNPELGLRDKKSQPYKDFGSSIRRYSTCNKGFVAGLAGWFTFAVEAFSKHPLSIRVPNQDQVRERIEAEKTKWEENKAKQLLITIKFSATADPATVYPGNKVKLVLSPANLPIDAQRNLIAIGQEGKLTLKVGNSEPVPVRVETDKEQKPKLVAEWNADSEGDKPLVLGSTDINSPVRGQGIAALTVSPDKEVQAAKAAAERAAHRAAKPREPRAPAATVPAEESDVHF